MIKGKYGFKSLEVRGTKDIELLRQKYEELLVAYEKEVMDNTKMNMQLELLEDK